MAPFVIPWFARQVLCVSATRWFALGVSRAFFRISRHLRDRQKPEVFSSRGRKCAAAFGLPLMVLSNSKPLPPTSNASFSTTAEPALESEPSLNSPCSSRRAEKVRFPEPSKRSWTLDRRSAESTSGLFGYPKEPKEIVPSVDAKS